MVDAEIERDLESHDWKKRASAMERLGSALSANPNKITILRVGTQDLEPGVVVSALRGLKMIEAYDWRTYDRACEIVKAKGQNEEVLLAASSLVEQIHAIMREHGKKLRDESAPKNLKISAINVLAKGALPESKKLIKEQLKSSEQAVREAAECALKRFDAIDKQRSRTDTAVSKMTLGLGEAEVKAAPKMASGLSKETQKTRRA